MQIGIVDYGAGNVTSVRKGFAAVGAATVLVRHADELADISALVVPGVGHFGATVALTGDLRAAIVGRVRAGLPVLGVCLGMQWLFEGSDEAGGVPGSGLIAGRCARLDARPPLKVPHVGWNALEITKPAPILEDIDPGAYMYFTHSFAAPVTSACVATTTHGESFAAAVQRDRICGVQFHPEKSGDAGLMILRNFVRMAGA